MKGRQEVFRLEGPASVFTFEGPAGVFRFEGPADVFRISGPADVFQDMGTGRHFSGYGGRPGNFRIFGAGRYLNDSAGALVMVFLFFSESFIGFQDTADDGL